MTSQHQQQHKAAKPSKRVHGLLFLLLPAAVFCLLDVLHVPHALLNPAGAQETGAHGAAGVDVQLAQLQQLLPTGDVTHTPPGIDPIIWHAFIPEDNAMTPERVALGRTLYFDTRLSADGTVACATCHDVTRSFTDRRNVSEGIGDKLGRRNAPTTLNAALLQVQFWDGRAATLEAQAALPILNPIEMGHPNEAAAVNAIKDDAEYQRLFQAAYGREVNYADLARAIAAFERTLIFLDAPFDAWLAGDEDAISADAKDGFVLFNGKARCVSCHPLNSANPLGTDNRFHNVGVSAHDQNFETLATQALGELGAKPDLTKIEQLALETDLSELGRFVVTKNRTDIGAFRTPQLRNVGITAPYMHDGSMQSLWGVMDHYNKGGEANPFLDGGIEALDLSEDEINKVVAFMFTLTDKRLADVNTAEQTRQQAWAAENRPFRDTELASRKAFAFERRLQQAAQAD